MNSPSRACSLVPRRGGLQHHQSASVVFCTASVLEGRSLAWVSPGYKPGTRRTAFPVSSGCNPVSRLFQHPVAAHLLVAHGHSFIFKESRGVRSSLYITTFFHNHSSPALCSPASSVSTDPDPCQSVT